MHTRNLYTGMIVLKDGTAHLITDISGGIVSAMNLDTHQMHAYEIKDYEVPFEPFTSDGANVIVNYNNEIAKVWKGYLKM